MGSKQASVREVAEEYFALSNSRDLNTIFPMFATDATYSSDTTGLFYGRDDIKQMMSEFFSSFTELHWEIQELRELSTHIVEIDFLVTARSLDGETSSRLGLERLVVADGKIRHIEVRSR